MTEVIGGKFPSPEVCDAYACHQWHDGSFLPSWEVTSVSTVLGEFLCNPTVDL